MLKRFTAEGRFECGLNALVAGKIWAFVAVAGDDRPAVLGVALQGEPGYHPLPERWAHADSLDDMQRHVDELNAAEGLDAKVAAQIVASTMRPQAPMTAASGATSFRTEFPDFDPATLPELPAGWEDRSWRNEACPWFFNRQARLALGIEYADPDRRSTPGAPRFVLCRVDVYFDGEPNLGGDHQVLLLATDDWAEMLTAIAAQPANDPKALAAEAFTLAIQHIQTALGVTTGDLASHFWSGNDTAVLAPLEHYARSEIAHAEPVGS